MSAQPSGALGRVKHGLRYGDADLIVYRDGKLFEVVVYFDDQESVTFHRPEIDELVWL